MGVPPENFSIKSHLCFIDESADAAALRRLTGEYLTEYVARGTMREVAILYIFYYLSLFISTYICYYNYYYYHHYYYFGLHYNA